jgi:hypothetical protein
MSNLRFSALSIGISGIFFVLYPAIRPFSDETSMDGAAAFASTEWLVAHILAIVAFTLLPLGLLGLYHSLQDTTLKPLMYSAVVLCLVGIGLTLPFYGGETYGLHAIGLEAMAQQKVALVSLANVVRSGTGLIMFMIGLLTLATSSIIVAITIWRSGSYQKWSGIPFALGMTLYLPQFLVGQPLRIVHGMLVTVGCIWIAVSLWKHNKPNYNHQNKIASP